MRLTPEIIRTAPEYLNPLQQREMSLRELGLVVIENLGVTEDLYESIDFCNNLIAKFDNFPVLKRLQTIFLSGNKIVKIAPGLGKSLPNLHALTLDNNHLKTLSDVESIAELGSSLTHLSIAGNPIVDEIANLRPLLLALLPKLTVLDANKLSPLERAAAATLRQRLVAGESLESLAIPKTAPEVLQKSSSGKVKLTKDQKKSLLIRIDAAKSVAEIEMLENILLNGIVPADFQW